jgi:haloalkane dehalogenase
MIAVATILPRMTNPQLTAAPLVKSYVTVNGKQMAYHDVGEGDPVVFLHGNPTSSYLWRNVIPHMPQGVRCIAPDLIGMGDSDKLHDTGPDSYRYVEHREYLDGLLDSLGLGDHVVFVVHDWGSALGFDWANRNRERVAGIAYMEAIVAPRRWDDFRPEVRGIFEGLRSPQGEEMVIENNAFVEQVLPFAVLRDLSEAEMDEYRRPYRDHQHRRPTLTWPRELPIDGEPADVVKIAEDYGAWLSTSDVPKLFVNAEPGAILTGRHRDFCRTWPNQVEVTVAGSHFVQEDSPREIGQAIARWLPRR